MVVSIAQQWLGAVNLRQLLTIQMAVSPIIC